jgi:hypothetical protein
MPTILRAAALAVFSLIALVLWPSATLGAASQEPAQDLPVSLDRIRTELAKPAPSGLRIDRPPQLPVATFRTRVDQRAWMLSFEDWLEKEFELTPLQRQSADWAARCCGISLDPLFKSMEKALQRRRVRKIREQIALELAQLEAARKNRDPSSTR